MRNLIEFTYQGLTKVISGGQTGGDQAGLFTAREFGIPTGGYAPLGYRTLFGFTPSLKEFGLLETASSGYPTRTKLNAQRSDATVRLASNFNSPGERLTLSLCNSFKKPVFDVLLNDRDYEVKAQALVDFLINHSVSCLNVAGNGDRDKPFGYHFDHAQKVLRLSFQILRDKDLLIVA